MLRIIIMLFIVASNCAHANGFVDPTVVHVIEGLKGYSLIYKSAPEESSFMLDLYIVSGTTKDEYQIVDSTNSRIIFAADTNVLIYDDVDSDSTYLIALTLSPHPQRDTILSFGNKDLTNWVNDVDCGFLGSIRDSIIACPITHMDSIDQYTDYIVGGMKVIKILPGKKWEIKDKFLPIKDYAFSNDYSQLLICTDYEDKRHDYPGGSILIYDPKSDTISCEYDAGMNNVKARRYSRESEIYYIKEKEGRRNIWSYLPGKPPRQLTDFNPEYQLFNMTLMKDRIKYMYTLLEDDKAVPYYIGYLYLK